MIIFNNGVKKLEKDKIEKLKNIKHSCNIRYLGFVEQQYITKTVEGKARAVRAYDEILKKIPKEINEKIVGPVNGIERINIDYKLGSIPNFYSLVPMSQTAHKPIFTLTSQDGVVGAHYQKVKEYQEVMHKIVQLVINRLEEFEQ